MKIRNIVTGEVVDKIKNPITNKDVEISESLARNLCYSQKYEPIDANEFIDPPKEKPKKKRGPKKKQNKEAENRLTK